MMTAENMHRETKWTWWEQYLMFPSFPPNVCLPHLSTPFSILLMRESVSASHASSFSEALNFFTFSSRALLLKLYHPCLLHLYFATSLPLLQDKPTHILIRLIFKKQNQVHLLEPTSFPVTALGVSFTAKLLKRTYSYSLHCLTFHSLFSPF